MVLALVLLGILLWKWLEADATEQAVTSADSSEIYNRVWLDSKPDKYTDYTQVFLILDFTPLCLFEKSSAYDIHAEFCEHSKKGDEIKVFFPQTARQESFKWRVTECDELPPFDLCLTMNENPWGGPKKYYSTSDPDSAVLAPHRERIESLTADRLEP